MLCTVLVSQCRRNRKLRTANCAVQYIKTTILVSRYRGKREGPEIWYYIPATFWHSKRSQMTTHKNTTILQFLSTKPSTLLWYEIIGEDVTYRIKIDHELRKESKRVEFT